MFGYVTANEPELKMRDYHEYKAWYCGLCQVLKKRYGWIGQMTLTYDMTFLVILLTSLYETKPEVQQHCCKSHPLRKQKMLINRFTEYAADMNLLLCYHHLLDDWQDEKSIKGLLGAYGLKPYYRKLKKKYPDKSRQIAYWLRRLQELEVRDETDIDKVSGCFGRIMEVLFVYEQDAWTDSLSRMSFFLGKYIYICDAFVDIEEDLETGSYNVLKNRFEHENFTDDCRFMLNLMMAECTMEFEKLPCIYDADILRNILYAGVWKRFNKKVQERSSQNPEPKNKGFRCQIHADACTRHSVNGCPLAHAGRN